MIRSRLCLSGRLNSDARNPFGQNYAAQRLALPRSLVSSALAVSKADVMDMLACTTGPLVLQLSIRRPQRFIAPAIGGPLHHTFQSLFLVVPLAAVLRPLTTS
jgi:hypothetical protein